MPELMARGEHEVRATTGTTHCLPTRHTDGPEKVAAPLAIQPPRSGACPGECCERAAAARWHEPSSRTRCAPTGVAHHRDLLHAGAATGA